MNKLTKGQHLQLAYRNYMHQFAPYLQFAITLTLKQTAKIDCSNQFRYWHKLDDERLQNTIRRFTALLTWALFGNQSKHKNKKENAKPLIITVVEGKNTIKHLHLHLAIGNIPQKHISNIQKIISQAWAGCDFANEEIDVQSIYESKGWLGYITKEVGYTDNDALDIVSSTIPPFIQQSICTESRLLTA
jgi:hypothetical protein